MRINDNSMTVRVVDNTDKIFKAKNLEPHMRFGYGIVNNVETKGSRYKERLSQSLLDTLALTVTLVITGVVAIVAFNRY